MTPLILQFDLLATAPGGVARLRELILTLAVQGKLVPQDPLEQTIRLDAIPRLVEKLIAEGKVPRSRSIDAIDQIDEFSIPLGWASVKAKDVFIPRSGNSKLIKGKFSPEPADDLFPGYSASGQDVWLPDYEYEGTAVILSAVGARCGKAFLANGKWSAVANTHIVWPLIEVVRADYAMLILNDESYWIRSGGAQPFVKVTETLEQIVQIPPIAEQARIVARVEELMRLCDALESQRQLETAQHAQLLSTLLGTLTDSTSADELAANWQRVSDHFDLLLDRPEAVDALEQTILQLAVRGLLSTCLPDEGRLEIGEQRASAADPSSLWSQVCFGDLLEDLRYGTSVKCGYELSGTPVLRIPNIKDGRINIQDLKQGMLDDREKAALCLKAGDVLIIRSNGSTSLVGSAAIVGKESEGFSFAGYLIRARFDSSHVDPKFILLVMRTSEIRSQIEAPIRTTSGVKNINSTEISRLSFQLPPLSEQHRIVESVAIYRSLCTDLRQRLSACQTTQSHLAEALVEV
jgi:type I restriction enzyme S subunit